MKLAAFLRLMRFDKPVGIYLLWFPAAWALWIANQGAPEWTLVAYFFVGSVVMRAAGCVVNDLADRNIDKHVARTRERPITTGEVGFLEGIGLFILLLLIALWIVLQLPSGCFYYALMGVVVTILYPFCKRWIEAPQLVLSVAFSVAIPMVYTASTAPMTQTMGLLILINLLWVVAYDTMYAMVDREDDLRLGVKSTAVLFLQYDKVIILCLQLLFHSLWLMVAKNNILVPFWFYLGWGIGGCVLLYQQLLLRKNAPAFYFRAFKSNAIYGLVMWLSICCGTGINELLSLPFIAR